MSSTWLQSLAEDYGLSVERVAALYQRAQGDRSRGTYGHFIELLEDEASKNWLSDGQGDLQRKLSTQSSDLVGNGPEVKT